MHVALDVVRQVCAGPVSDDEARIVLRHLMSKDTVLIEGAYGGSSIGEFTHLSASAAARMLLYHPRMPSRKQFEQRGLVKVTHLTRVVKVDSMAWVKGMTISQLHRQLPPAHLDDG